MHVDDFIDGHGGDRYARFMFLYFRLPAALQIDFAPFMAGNKLFCTYEGKRYRVTGASRLGDVWLQPDFDKDHGYEHRVDVTTCSEWGATP